MSSDVEFLISMKLSIFQEGSGQPRQGIYIVETRRSIYERNREYVVVQLPSEKDHTSSSIGFPPMQKRIINRNLSSRHYHHLRIAFPDR